MGSGDDLDERGGKVIRGADGLQEHSSPAHAGVQPGGALPGARLETCPQHRVARVDDELLPGLGVLHDDQPGVGQLVVDSGDPLLRARFRAGAGERDARLDAGMRRAGVPLHRIGTADDLASSLIEVVDRTHRRRA